MEKLFETVKEYKEWQKSQLKKVRDVVTCNDSGILTVKVIHFDGWEDEYELRIKELEEEKYVKTWGGTRPGAGRKKGEETVQFGCRLKVETKQFLQDQAAAAGITVTEALETIIQIFRDEHR